MTSKKESRQARRYRERRHVDATSQKSGVSTIPHPYVLLCRAEDDEQDGFWAITVVDSPWEGDQLTREYQQHVGRLTMRCDLVTNTDEAITAWAGQSVARKTALAKFRENRR
jgi:hypothetical protein